MTVPFNLFFVLGPTNTGKSTFLKTALENLPDSVGLIEVGKMLRAKFPPEYFKGQAAPQHTQKIAMELCHQKIEEHVAAGKTVLLVDGQPRNVTQAEEIFDRYLTHGARFIHLYTPTHVREARMLERDKDNPGNMELAKARLHGDIPSLYEVLSLIGDVCPERLVTYNTTAVGFNALNALKILLIMRRNTFEEKANAAGTTGS